MERILICLILLTSCKVTTKVYYHDTSEIDDDEFGKDSFNLFFDKDSNIKEKLINSKKLNKELIKIKSKLCQKIVNDDSDYYYDYALITSSNDTLYSNSLIIWNYDEKVSRIENKKIRKILI